VLSTACGQRLWTLWTPDRVAQWAGAGPVDDARAAPAAARTLPGMPIDMPAAEVLAMAASLRRSAADADEIGVRLRGTHSVGGDLQPAVEAFVESHRVTGEVLAGELRWLGVTIAGVADSWLRLDGALVRARGRMSAE
jgi:hypothetical protein